MHELKETRASPSTFWAQRSRLFRKPTIHEGSEFFKEIPQSFFGIWVGHWVGLSLFPDGHYRPTSSAVIIFSRRSGRSGFDDMLASKSPVLWSRMNCFLSASDMLDKLSYAWNSGIMSFLGAIASGGF